MKYFYSLLIPVNLYLTDKIYVYMLESPVCVFQAWKKTKEAPDSNKSMAWGQSQDPVTHKKVAYRYLPRLPILQWRILD